MRCAAPLLLLLALLLASCAPRTSETPWPDIAEVTPRFLVQEPGADPSLAVDERGRVALTWVTRGTAGADAWVSVSGDLGAHWSAPVRLNDKPANVSSYPESRPVAAWGRGGLLVAAWASKRDSVEFADDIAVRVSADGGREWGSVVVVNDDADDPASTYHGFIAVDVLPDGQPLVAWIDGRNTVDVPGEEPLRAEVWASLSGDGGASWNTNTRLATEVCPCCRIALQAAPAAGGTSQVALAYRGAQNDLRDPRLALSTDGGATFAMDTLVSADRWKLEGCPSMGPALSMHAEGGVMAWYTGESPEDSALGGRPAPGVYLTAWRMGSGPVGPKRTLRDSLADPGRPMLARLTSGTLVGAIGGAVGGPPRKVLGVRLLESGGAFTPWVYLGSAVKSAAVAAARGDAAWAAWAETAGDRTRVRVARLAGR